MASRSTERARALGFPSYRAYRNARAQELGYRNFAEQVSLRKAARAIGDAPKRGATRTEITRDHSVNVFRDIWRDWLKRRGDISLEAEPHANRIHYIFTFPFHKGNADKARGYYERVRQALINQVGFMYARVNALYIDYEIMGSVIREWRSSAVSTTVREFYKRYPTPFHVAIEVEAREPTEMQIIFMDARQGKKPSV